MARKQRNHQKRKSASPKASRPYMPGYGLPKSTRGLLPWKWAEQRLKKNHNYWIITVRPDDRPHAMVVWGLWMDGIFYFSTGRQSRKARNLSQNANCIIGTERADQAVVVEGVAEEVGDVELRRRFLRIYEKKYDWDMASFEEGILSLKEPIYAVRPKVVFALDEEKFQSAATRWMF
jgi:uncharacterized pyridoxamine 5'-phosphate oxidase family protein